MCDAHKSNWQKNPCSPSWVADLTGGYITPFFLLFTESSRGVDQVWALSFLRVVEQIVKIQAKQRGKEAWAPRVHGHQREGLKGRKPACLHQEEWEGSLSSRLEPSGAGWGVLAVLFVSWEEQPSALFLGVRIRTWAIPLKTSRWRLCAGFRWWRRCWSDSKVSSFRELELGEGTRGVCRGRREQSAQPTGGPRER